ELIDFHIVNATPDTPPGIEAHQKIQIPFELHGQDVKVVGFWSSQHQGVFTPMGTNMHAHFQTPDNKVSGHVQGLKIAQGLSDFDNKSDYSDASQFASSLAVSRCFDKASQPRRCC